MSPAALLPAGDSRAVLARDAGGGAVAVQLSWDARPEHPDEMARIQVRPCIQTAHRLLI